MKALILTKRRRFTPDVISSDRVGFRIEYQRFVCDNFNPNPTDITGRHKFKASNGIIIHSAAFFQVQINALAVLGSSDFDVQPSTWVTCTTAEYEKILIAVQEYNNHVEGISSHNCGLVLCKDCMKDVKKLIRF